MPQPTKDSGERLRDDFAKELHRVMCCDHYEHVIAHGFQEAADGLMPWLQHQLDRMKFVAHEGGWDAAMAYTSVSGGMVSTYSNVCAAGVGGGETCARRAGHDGDHDSDSTEVYL